MCGVERVLPLSRAELSEAFNYLDEDCSGCIERDELEEAVTALGVKNAGPGLRAALPGVQIDEEAFIAAYARKCTPDRLRGIAELERAFKSLRALALIITF